MAYEPIGSPSGNNLYITIPQRGTQNWDEKLRTGFYDKVSEHDHTPGKGAAIREVALDAPLQAKIAQIATNTSEISQNATNIQQNASNILTNVQNISSNDTDIAALDTRVTNLESGSGSSPNSYTLTTSNANTELPASLSNADVIIAGAFGTISNKTFENVRFSLDANCTFQSCTFTNCFIGEGDDGSGGYDFTLGDSTAYKTQIFGMGTVSIDSSNFYRGSIKATTLDIDNTSATSIIDFEKNIVNLTSALYIRGNSSYRTDFLSNDVKCSLANFVSGSQNAIYLSNTRIDTLKITSDGNYLTASSTGIPTIIAHETGTAGSIFRLRDLSNNEIANLSGAISPFKIVDGAYSVYDKGGNTDIIVSARGALVTIGNNTDQPVISGTGALYDPDSVVVGGDVTLDAGNYLVSALVNPAGAGTVSLKVIITPSGGSANTIFTISNGSDPVALNDLIIAANQGDVLSVKFSAQLATQPATTLYTLKKIL